MGFLCRFYILDGLQRLEQRILVIRINHGETFFVHSYILHVL